MIKEMNWAKEEGELLIRQVLRYSSDWTVRVLCATIIRIKYWEEKTLLVNIKKKKSEVTAASNDASTYIYVL